MKCLCHDAIADCLMSYTVQWAQLWLYRVCIKVLKTASWYNTADHRAGGEWSELELFCGQFKVSLSCRMRFVIGQSLDESNQWTRWREIQRVWKMNAELTQLPTVWRLLMAKNIVFIRSLLQSGQQSRLTERKQRNCTPPPCLCTCQRIFEHYHQTKNPDVPLKTFVLIRICWGTTITSESDTVRKTSTIPTQPATMGWTIVRQNMTMKNVPKPVAI